MPRKECDRFVSLAFCAAEVPLEVDEKWMIIYPAGGISAPTEFEWQDAIGKSCLDLIDPAEKFYVAGRLDTTVVQKVFPLASAKGVPAMTWKAVLSIGLTPRMQIRLAKVFPGEVFKSTYGNYAMTEKDFDWQSEFFGG